MCRVWIVGGTTEGRLLADFCTQNQIFAWVSVVSEYGGSLLEKSRYVEIVESRMDESQMEAFLREQGITSVFDASHPYAKLVSGHAREACRKTKVPYYRILRQETKDSPPGLVWVKTAQEGAAYLAHRPGNIFLSTGSKELEAFTEMEGYQERIYARVLPDVEVLEKCKKLGLKGSHIIAMQGPFTKGINREMFAQVNARYLVTKESGGAGGFLEKVEGALQLGLEVVVIGRGSEETGYPLTKALEILGGKKREAVTDFYLIGTGMGDPNQLTLEAFKAIQGSQAIFGAPRLLSQLKTLTADKITAPLYLPSQLETWLLDHERPSAASVLFSGDTGFYSGCKKMADALKQRPDCRVHILPGISSISYLCSKLQISWEDVAIHSLHGRDGDVKGWLEKDRKVFVLLGGEHTVSSLCKRLVAAGYPQVRISVGERLSQADERILSGLAKDMAGEQFDSLCAVLLVREETKDER